MGKIKIGIVTLTDYTNYGNRLQNYALKTYLENSGYQVESLIIQNDSRENKKLYRIYKNLLQRNVFTNINHLFTLHLPRFIEKSKEKMSMDENQEKLAKNRVKLFKEFSEKYLNERRIKLSEFNSNNYDFLVTGSDQVWNPGVYYDLGIYFLDFVEKEKRISYAASIGVSEIPEELKEKYKIWLTQMKYISVREQAGADIVKKLTNREVPVLVDPTMLLTKEQWLQLSTDKKNKLSKKRYLLTYFLGEQDEEKKNAVQKISRQYNLETIDLYDIDSEIFAATPSDFIDYIAGSTIFLTDSFHGVVFSILLEKPFIIFKRGKMNSRINTLLEKFNLEARKNGKIDNYDDILNIDYTNKESILNEEKELSDVFFNKSFGIDNK